MDAATLGNFISTQRKKLGMTQKELAEALGINLVELMTYEIKDMEAEQLIMNLLGKLWIMPITK